MKLCPRENNWTGWIGCCVTGDGVTDRIDSSSTTLDSSVRIVSQSSSLTSTLDDASGTCRSGVAVINDEADSSLTARAMGTSGRVVGADTRVTGGTDGRVLVVDASVTEANGKVTGVDVEVT